MTAIPTPSHTTVKAIYETYERKEEELRTHLGASEIGGVCERENWYGFRWSRVKRFEGRMLRLFNRGHREEPVLINDLINAGVEVMAFDSKGEQFEFMMFGGHFGGHLDAMLKGLIEAPKTWHVGEFKTHKDSKWEEVVKKGVRVAQPKHFVQMNLYMGKTGTTRGAYFAVNKNDDRIQLERVEFDKELYERTILKAERIIFSDLPPPRISERAEWWQCARCDYKEICHAERLPEVTCRSCAHTTPTRDGKWTCSRHTIDDLSAEDQKMACGEHRYIPIFLERFAEVHKASDEQNWVQYKHRRTGETFVNGPSPGFSSIELRDNKFTGLLGHPVIEAMKAQFPNARLVNEQPQTQLDLGAV